MRIGEAEVMGKVIIFLPLALVMPLRLLRRRRAEEMSCSLREPETIASSTGRSSGLVTSTPDESTCFHDPPVCLWISQSPRLNHGTLQAAGTRCENLSEYSFGTS